jgi:hypothetical protein
VRRGHLGGHRGSSASRPLFREEFFRRQCRAELGRRESPFSARVFPMILAIPSGSSPLLRMEAMNLLRSAYDVHFIFNPLMKR